MKSKKWTIYVAIFVTAVVAMGALYVVDHALFWRYERDVVVKASRMSVKEKRQANVVLLFVGDSIMDNFPMASHWGDRFKYRNIGVGGLGINQIVEKYKDSSMYIPRGVLVVEGGLNDILGCVQRQGCTQEQVVDLVLGGVRSIVDTELQHNAGVVFVTSITPVTRKFLLPYFRAISLPTAFDPGMANSYIDYANARLKKMCMSYDSSRVKYIDVSSPLKLDGALNRRYGAADGYHINQEGYQIVSSVVEDNILKNVQ